MPETEIAAITQQVHKRHKLIIIRFNKATNDMIEIYLADKPDRPHGIIVVFRKVDGKWQEDAKSQSEWIM